MNNSVEARRLKRGADLAGLPRFFGQPAVKGVIRHEPGDFRVRESLAFDLSDTGEHLYLLVRKTGQNTRWVARQLAHVLNLPFRSVGYAGMKDRHAVAEQWFSVHLPGRADPGRISIDGVEVLARRRHGTKLRIGALNGNRFSIVLRDLTGDMEELARRLTGLRDGFVPNYFGAQRFGRGGANLDLLGKLGERTIGSLGRESRSFALSALRSALFNNYLARRIESNSANRPMCGEIVYGEEGYRHEPDVRARRGEFRPTGLLWGAGESRATGAASEDECAFFAQYPAATKLLASRQLRMIRRPLMIRPAGLEWQFEDRRATLSFSLGRGQFATAVLRECLTWPDDSPGIVAARA